MSWFSRRSRPTKTTMTRLSTPRGTNEPDKDHDVLMLSRASVGRRLEGESGRDDVDRARPLRPHGRATGAARMDDPVVAKPTGAARPRPGGAREDRDVMSKSPLGYTEASSATPPGGSRPDSSATSEATSVASERFGHTDRMKDHRILVVDDEPASRKGLQELLTVWGYDVNSASDGQEALERAAVRAPDLVIADLIMPGIDGLELLTRLKRDFPTTAVVFLTGQGSIETAVQAIKDGAYDYLTKPVDPTRLQLLLDRVLER